MQPHQCRRCGATIKPGEGRYIMILTFVADVDFELVEPKGDIQENIKMVIEEIERTPEDELMKQVYQKEAFLICRKCKEEMAANPFGPSLPTMNNLTQ